MGTADQTLTRPTDQVRDLVIDPATDASTAPHRPNVHRQQAVGERMVRSKVRPPGAVAEREDEIPMSSLQITGRSGDAVAVAESTINAVASELDGSLLRPDDDGYAESVSLWNAMVAKRPAVVIRAGSTGDVVRAVTFAREEGLELSIKQRLPGQPQHHGLIGVEFPT